MVIQYYLILKGMHGWIWWCLEAIEYWFWFKTWQNFNAQWGKSRDPEEFWKTLCTDKEFKECMADCAFSVVKNLEEKWLLLML